MILYLSDFDMRGSGYMNIGVRLCDQLAARYGGDEVLALGLNYQGQEHNWPYRILPVEHVGHIPQILELLSGDDEELSCFISAMDLMFQENMLATLKQKFPNMPYVALFPLEAGPLCQPWAARLHQADARLVMSEFGRKELADAGVPARFIPIGVSDPSLWSMPDEAERRIVRKALNIEEDSLVVLTVADNQERKNLSVAAQILAQFSVDVGDYSKAGLAMNVKEKRKLTWILVTRVNSPVGWRLDDLGMRTGILSRMLLYDRGVSHDKLKMLFDVADCFLLTSKAEGLAIPVMEAMACGLPVIGTRCCAIEEHLQSERGLMILPEYKYIDPYGNGWRYFAEIADGVAQLENLVKMPADEKQAMTAKARNYVLARTWNACGDILAEAVEEARAACGLRRAQPSRLINGPKSDESNEIEKEEHEQIEA